MVSSSNYAVVKQDVNLDDDEEYDDSIFDNLINNFISDSEADNTDQLLPEHDSPTTLPSSDASEPTFEDSMLLTYTFHHLLIQRKFLPYHPPIRHCLTLLHLLTLMILLNYHWNP